MLIDPNSNKKKKNYRKHKVQHSSYSNISNIFSLNYIHRINFVYKFEIYTDAAEELRIKLFNFSSFYA